MALLHSFYSAFTAHNTIPSIYLAYKKNSMNSLLICLTDALMYDNCIQQTQTVIAASRIRAYIGKRSLFDYHRRFK